MVERPVEGFDSAAFIGGAKRRVAARLHTLGAVRPGARAGRKRVLAQHDVLTGNVRLVETSVIVATHDAGIGRGSLRPVEPLALEGELLRGVVTGREVGDERRDEPGDGLDGHDARAVVLSAS